MAFLCPSRLGKKAKKKKEAYHNALFGRITGSDSVDTLTRVGLEKENGLDPDTRMIILHDFTAHAKDELTVKQGNKVYMLFRENDWAYVISGDAKEGFVPFTFCAKVQEPPSPQTKKTTKEIDLKNLNISGPFKPAKTFQSESFDSDSFLTSEWSDMSFTTTSRTADDTIETGTVDLTPWETDPPLSQQIIPETSAFKKQPHGEFLILYDFEAQDENDVSVLAGEIVTVLNTDDHDWYWVKKANFYEGFVPRVYLISMHLLRDPEPFSKQHKKHSTINNHKSQQTSPNPNTTNQKASNTVPSTSSHHTDSDTLKKTKNTNHNVKTNSALDSTVSEYIVLFDYVAESEYDLTVKKGELLYLTMAEQHETDDWFWAHSQKLQKYGYVPRTYVIPNNHSIS